MIFIILFFTFFKIGAFTFGGGYAMLPLIQAEVLSNNWIDKSELINFVAVSESTPGPFAINIATYIGSELGGFFGAFFSTLGIVLPSFIIILIIAKFFEKFKNNKTVKACMSGLKPAVIGLIGAALISISETVFFTNGITFDVFKTTEFYVSLAIVILMTTLAFKKIHPIIIICISAVIGIIAGFLL